MAWFSEGDRWSAGSFSATEWAWPEAMVRPLREALEPVSVPVKPTDFPHGHPPLMTIRFDGSVERRDADPGSIKGRLFVARAGEIVYSKIDVRNGAIGIVPPWLPVVAVTSEYPVHRVRDEVATVGYLRLLVRSSGLRRVIQSRISGASGRKRILPADLLSMRAPLPALDVQRAIVAHAERAEAAVRRAEGGAEALRLGAQAAFLRGLGLHLPEAHERPKAMTLRWSAVERWGVGFNQRMAGGGLALEGTFPVVRLGDVVADLENGWSPKCLPRPAEGDEWGVLKLGAVSFGRYDASENKALPRPLKPVLALEVRVGDVLISRANIPRLVGACARVEQTRPRLMLCDKIFRVVPPKDSPVEPEYLTEILKIPQVRFQIESACTGTSPTMQNITKPALLGLRFPRPPLDVQRALVADLTKARAASDAMLAEARSVRATAMADVDAMILGTVPVPAFLTEAWAVPLLHSSLRS